MYISSCWIETPADRPAQPLLVPLGTIGSRIQADHAHAPPPGRGRRADSETGLREADPYGFGPFTSLGNIDQHPLAFI